jgi:hypothetical protein
MTLRLNEIKPSPYNPKKPLSKKEYKALLRNVEKYGFQRDLLVCRDYRGGDGYICLDGHTAVELHKSLGKETAECRLVETVTDENSLVEFMTGWMVGKQPLLYEIYQKTGERIEELLGVSSKNLQDTIQEAAKTTAEAIAQTQYFLTLPPDCVSKLKAFVKTKAYKAGKTEAIAAKIDAMNDTIFLENILQIAL